MPSVIGLLFISAGAFAFFKRPEYLLPLLVFSGIFQDASIVSASSVGVQPYYAVAILLVFRAILLSRGRLSFQRVSRGECFLAVFTVVAVVGAFVLPVVFAGTPVYDPRGGIDTGFVTRSSLSFSVTNTTQAGFLVLNACVVFAARRVRSYQLLVDKSFHFTFYFLLLIIGMQFCCLHLGIPFPNKLLNNNLAHAAADMEDVGRPNGTFSEPSYCGATLAMFAIGFLVQYIRNRGSILRVSLCAAALLAVASSSSLLAFGVMTTAALLAHPIFRFPGFIRIDRLKRMSVFLFLAMTAAVLLMIPPFQDLLFEQTFGKSDSWSYLVRTSADLYAVQIASDTHWIGVGLGSNRPSSLLASLLGNAGVVGLSLFMLTFAKLIRSAKKSDSWMAWAGCALLICMSLGIPDVTFPEMWVLIAICVSRGGPGPIRRECAVAVAEVKNGETDGFDFVRDPFCDDYPRKSR